MSLPNIIRLTVRLSIADYVLTARLLAEYVLTARLLADYVLTARLLADYVLTARLLTGILGRLAETSISENKTD